MLTNQEKFDFWCFYNNFMHVVLWLVVVLSERRGTTTLPLFTKIHKHFKAYVKFTLFVVNDMHAEKTIKLNFLEEVEVVTVFL